MGKRRGNHEDPIYQRKDAASKPIPGAWEGKVSRGQTGADPQAVGDRAKTVVKLS
jgi:hypothetical protein